MTENKPKKIKSWQKKKSWYWQTCFSAWLPVILWMSLLFFLSSRAKLPGPEDEIWRFIFMKSAHIGAYGVLYFWCWRGWQLGITGRTWLGKEFWSRSKKVSGVNKKNEFLIWLGLLIICILFAISDEYHQSFVPGRTATWRDVGFDTLGASLGMLVIWRWTRSSNNRHQQTE